MASIDRVALRMEKQLWPQELERIEGLMNSAYNAEIPSYTREPAGYAGGPWDIMMEIGDKVFCYNDRGTYTPYYLDNNGKWRQEYDDEPVDERLTALWKELVRLSPLNISPYESRYMKDEQ